MTGESFFRSAQCRLGSALVWPSGGREFTSNGLVVAEFELDSREGWQENCVMRLFDVYSPCPTCADHPIRSVAVDLDEVEAEKTLRVFSNECGHFWNLPEGEASKIKNSYK
jgi:hypothetical protein